MRREPMDEVELVEPSSGPGDAGGDAARAGAGNRADRSAGVGADATTGGRRRLAGRWVVLLGAAVVGGLLVTQAVLDARERAVLARYADVPGVLAPVDGTIDVLWRLDALTAPLLYDAVHVDGLLVGGRFEASGAQTAVALDARTGEVAWSTRLAATDTDVRSPESDGSVPCSGDGAPTDDPVLTCLVLGTDPDGVAGTAPRPAELVALDARSGSVLRRTPASPTLGLRAVGATLVTADVDPDGTLRVDALDPRSGEPVWTFATPPGAADPAAGAPWLTSTVDGEALVQVSSGAWLLDAHGALRTAAQLDADVQSADQVVTRLRSGRLAITTYLAQAYTTRLLDEDGRPVATIPAAGASISADDGSTPDVLLLAGADEVPHAWDAVTGAPAWEDETLASGSGVVLDGTYYGRGTGGALAAVRLSDGATLWRSTADGVTGSTADTYGNPVMTDGRSILVPVRRGEDFLLEAYARDDGRREWSTPLPDGILMVSPVGGLLVGWTGGGDEQVVLG